MDSLGSSGFSSDFRHKLGGRLLDARTIVVSEAVDSDVCGSITEQLALLDAESQKAIRIVFSSAPGGDVESALSTYDFVRSVSAPVTMLGGGRISGAGVVGFVGATADRRLALPHVRFQFEEPKQTSAPGPASDVEEMAEQAKDLRRRMIGVLTEATGQEEEQIEEDVRRRRTFDAEAALEYGLISRIVQSRQAPID